MYLQHTRWRVTRRLCRVYFYLDFSFSRLRPQVYLGFHSLICFLPTVQFAFLILCFPLIWLLYQFPVSRWIFCRSYARLLHHLQKTNWPTDKLRNLVTECKIWHTSFLFPYVWLFQKFDKYWVYFNCTHILCWMDATEVWSIKQFVVETLHFIETWWNFW